MSTYHYKYLKVKCKTYGLSYGLTADEHIEKAINVWAAQGYRVAKYDVFHGGEETIGFFLMENEIDPIARLLDCEQGEAYEPRGDRYEDAYES